MHDTMRHNLDPTVDITILYELLPLDDLEDVAEYLCVRLSLD